MRNLKDILIAQSEYFLATDLHGLNKMKKKSKEKRKEEKESQVASGGLPEFYELLDTLLAQSSKLLRDTLENYKERLESNPTKEKDETIFLLELEKEKNKCVLELLGIAIEQYQRVSADYSNFQKRVPKQIADSIAYKKEAIIRTLLPVLDNFEHMLGNAESSGKTDAIIKGVEIIYKQLLDILKLHGVEQINAVGSKFDPSIHEAMLQRADKEKEEGIVLEEFQKGYKLNDRVIRPNKVVVNTLSDEQETTGGTAEGQEEQKEQDEKRKKKSESD